MRYSTAQGRHGRKADVMNLIKEKMVSIITCAGKTIEEKKQCDFFRPHRLDCFWKGGKRCYSDAAREEYESTIKEMRAAKEG